MKKSSKSSTKKQPTAAEYTKRLGPVRKVVRLVRASDPRGSFKLHLECKHVRRARSARPCVAGGASRCTPW